MIFWCELLEITLHGLQRIIFAIKMQIIYYRLYNLPESFHDDAFVAKNMKYDSCGPYKILAGEQISWFTVAI